MTAIYVIGWFAVVVAGAVLFSGAHTLLGELAFRARWKWGDARKIKRSVRLGWNTGMPPEGKPILVREYAKDLPSRKECLDYGWAVLVRRGARCYSMSGGFSTPATNVTGWLEIEQPNVGGNPRERSAAK